ncbi:MAG: hypothetical protein K1X75_15145, partial [Leptospirales bacterium]|nr:hypothetical protein [Leptospirales bacterium]
MIHKYSTRLRNPFRRRIFRSPVALLLLPALLYAAIAPLARLNAEPFRAFEERDRQRVRDYANRANRLSDVASWTNYVSLGVATERAAWEDDALDVLDQQLRDIEAQPIAQSDIESQRQAAQAAYQTARSEWESAAEEALLEERGAFRAAQALLQPTLVTSSELEAIVDAAHAAVAAEFELDLDLWDQSAAQGLGSLHDQLNSELGSQLAAARSSAGAMSPEEQAAFDAELTRREADIRRDFQIQESFYIKRGRNQYIALKREDDFSARLAADQQSADAIGDALLDETTSAVEEEADALLAAADAQLSEAQTALSGAQLEEDWNARVEEMIASGLRRWEQAEEKLYQERLAWTQATRASRETAEALWDENHKKLKAARDAWAQSVKDKVAEGRSKWEEKFQEFRESRLRAEADLERLVAEERARQDQALGGVGEMVRGGGAALLQAKEARRYYQDRLGALGYNQNSPRITAPANDTQRLAQFYQDEIARLGESITRFEAILNNSEDSLAALLYGQQQGEAGHLVDRRQFAGQLLEDVRQLDGDDFQNELLGLIEDQPEGAFLYQRDLNNLIERNQVFVSRLGAVEANIRGWLTGASSIADLETRIQRLDVDYAEQRREMLEIVHRQREAADDAARLAAIKSELQAWLEQSLDPNARLQRITLRYFEDGLEGYYLSGEDNDPYLLTQAEYEWELLRRERNYVAGRLERAQAVKRYAELAAKHDAGLEAASITKQKAELARSLADVRELRYLILTGDLVIAPEARSDADVRQSEKNRILSERGIQTATVEAAMDGLQSERSLYEAIAGAAAPDAAGIAALLQQAGAALSGAPSSAERLGAFVGRLQAYQSAIEQGADAAALQNKWAALQGAAGFMIEELRTLQQEYDGEGLLQEVALLDAQMQQATLIEQSGAVRDAALILEQHEANSRPLYTALEEARAAYKQAYVDFQILSLGAAERAEILRSEVTQSAQQLAATLNRLQSLEGLGAGQSASISGKAGYDLLVAVSQARQGAELSAQSGEALQAVEGLQAAGRRSDRMEELLAASGGDALALAEALLANEDQLIDFDNAEGALRSSTLSGQAYGDLFSANQSRQLLQQQLGEAEAEVDQDASRIAELKAALLLSERRMVSASEAFVLTLRREVEARQLGLQRFIDQDGSQEQSLTSELEEQQRQFQDLNNAAAREAGDVVSQFLAAHQGQSYAELVAAAEQELAAIERPLRLSEADLLAVPAWNRAEALLRWLAGARAAIDYANHTAEAEDFDRRTPAEKWQSLLESVNESALQSEAAALFLEALPAEADDARVDDFREQRGALLIQVQSILSGADGALLGGYAALGVEERDILDLYGAIDRATPQRLRRSLQAMADNLRRDLDSLSWNFRAALGAELGRTARAALLSAESDSQRLGQMRSAMEAELAQLRYERDRAAAARATESDPDQQQVLDAQLAALNDRASFLEGRLSDTALEFRSQRAQMLRQSMLLQLASGGAELLPGVALTAPALSGAGLAVQMKRYALSLMRGAERGPEREEPAAMETALALGGYLQLDENGAIRRGADGQPLLSERLQLLGFSAAPATMSELLSRIQSGPELEALAARMLQALDDGQLSQAVPPEILQSVRLLENQVSALAAARALVNARGMTQAEIRAEAQLRLDRIEAIRANLGRIDRLESDLRSAVEQARSEGRDPGAAALAILESQQHQAVFHLFAGYDPENLSRPAVDEAIQARVEELLRLAERLRAAQADQMALSLADGYAATLGDSLLDIDLDPGPEQGDEYTPIDRTLAQTPEQFLEQVEEFRADDVLTALGALAADSFRAGVWQYLNNTNNIPTLYRSAILSALHRNHLDGADLKNAALAAVEQAEQGFFDRLHVLVDSEAANFVFGGDRALEESVADFVLNWSTTHGLNLSAEELEAYRLRKEFQELSEALALSAAGIGYRAANFRPELRDFVLLDSYDRARRSMEEYRAASASPDAAEREAASLDLSGVLPDVAEHFLVGDFEQWLSAHPLAAAIDGDHQGYSVSDHIAAYLEERHSSLALLPRGGAALFERLTQQEYQRLRAAGAVEAISERDFAGDLEHFALASKAVYYMQQAGIVLSGATLAEQRSNFEAAFAAMLDDAAFAQDGKTLRARLLTEGRVALFQETAFSLLRGATQAEDYLPDALARLRLDGALDAPLKAPIEFLPEELRAIAGYETADARAALPGESYRRALAILESRAASGGAGAYSAYLEDRDIQSILEDARYAGTPLEAELALDLRHSLERNWLQGSEDPLGALRSELALRALYSTETQREALLDFQAQQGPRLERVESAFFAELQRAPDALQQAAKEQRGAFLRALSLQAGGQSSALRDGLNAADRAAFDAMADRLLGASGRLSSEDRSALSAKIDSYAKLFDLASAQELASNPAFGSLDRYAQSVVVRSGNAALESAAKQERNALTQALAELIWQSEDPGYVLSAQSAALFGRNQGLEAMLRNAQGEMDRGLRQFFVSERLMAQRFFYNYVESEAERNRLRSVLQSRDFYEEAGDVSGAERWRQSLLAAQETESVSFALLASIDDHGRAMQRLAREMSREAIVARELKRYGELRGDDALQSQFASYRTFLGGEEEYLLTQWENYVRENGGQPNRNDRFGSFSGGAGQPLMDFAEFFGGQILLSESQGVDVDALFTTPDWESTLQLDDVSQGQEATLPGAQAGDPDRIVKINIVKTVSDAAARVGLSDEQLMQRLQLEHLANHYLEAASQLQQALLSLDDAAALANARRDSGAQAQVAAALQPAGAMPDLGDEAALAQLADALTALRQEGQTLQSDNGQIQLQEKQQALQSAYEGRQAAADQFARAARRDLLAVKNLGQYVATVFQGIADQLNQAQQNVADAEEQGRVLRQNHEQLASAYRSSMNEGAQLYRRYEAAAREYEQRQAVADYAESPYLAISGQREDSESLEDWAKSAATEYERAYGAYQTAQERLREAGYAVAEQDNLDELYAIVEAMDNGQSFAPLAASDRERLSELLQKKYDIHDQGLSQAESDELAALRQRAQAEKFGDLIAARREHIRHTQRMVRIEKARSLVQAEIARRQAEVAEKERQYKESLAQNFGAYNPPANSTVTQEQFEESRYNVYKRLAMLQEQSGASNLWTEYLGWYWGSPAWAEAAVQGAGTALYNGQPLRVTPRQVQQAAWGLTAAAVIPEGERGEVGTWLAGGGMTASYGAFRNNYTGFMTAVGVADLMQLQATITRLGLAGPILGMLNGSAAAFLQAQIYLASIFLVALAAGPLVTATALAAAAIGLQAQIAAAQLTAAYTEMFALLSMIVTVQSAEATEATEVRKKEQAYEEARAGLDYFTKAPSSDELKNRLQAWGTTQRDENGNALYELTDADLSYLFAEDAAGNPVYDDELVESERGDALNATTLQDDSRFRDSQGRRYDPATLQDDPPAGYSEGSWGGYTRVRVMGANGQYSLRYAQLIASDAVDTKTLNMGRILDALSVHGTVMRNDALQRYEAEGASVAGGNAGFLLAERSSTYRDLFEYAGEQGREFEGYGLTADDYTRNARDIVSSSLFQNVQVQRQEWALREADLQQRFNEWSAKFKSVLENGSKSWARAEDRYLQAWRTWRHDQDVLEAEGQAKWEEQIRDHMTARTEWETNMRNNAAQLTVEEQLGAAIDALNTQIAQSEQNLQTQLSPIDRTAFIQGAIADLEAQQPTLSEKFANINDGISAFHAKLAIGEIQQQEFSGISANFDQFASELATHQRNMTTLANARMLEQFLKLEDELKEQVRRQDRAIQSSTANAALGLGLGRVGNDFIGKPAGSPHPMVVNGYVSYDVDLKFEQFKKDLSNEEFNFANLQSILDSLSTKSEVEIESFFHVANLKLTRVFEKVMGVGTGQQRETARDANTIGDFGVWAGAAPGQTQTTQDNQQILARLDPETASRLALGSGNVGFLGL